jgi:cell fate (sporulation/competence/biofilm development) regulator YlbF (YheA/YmcA/DUF963 family)
MATTEQILKAASDLGKLIQQHASTKRVAESGTKLQKDTEALRLINDLNRLMSKISEKEMTGKPIEPAEKQQLQTLQSTVARNATLREYQLAQMDYLDIMRAVDQAMSGEADEAPAGVAPAPAAAPASKIVL